MTQLNDLIPYSGRNHEVWLYYASTNRWCCSLRVDSGTTKLEVKKQAVTPEEAFTLAKEEFDRIIQSGAPELAGPLLEHGTPMSSPYRDDDPPF